MSDSSLEFFDDDFDPAAFDQIDDIESAFARGELPPRKFGDTPPKFQTTLFGGAVKDQAQAGKKGSSSTVGKGKVTVAQVKVVKKWDLTAFAEHGWSKRVAAEKKGRKAKAKGQEKNYDSDEEAWDREEEVEEDDEEPDVYLPAERLPIKFGPDAEKYNTWIYPVQADKPLRSYQYNIVHKALFADTLVSLPTGLGKTFIAACVM